MNYIFLLSIKLIIFHNFSELQLFIRLLGEKKSGDWLGRNYSSKQEQMALEL